MPFPSNKTSASEGGAVPMHGVTTFGFGSHTSVASGFVKSFLKRESVCADNEQIAKQKEVANNNFTMLNNFDFQNRTKASA
jgi:hypothetical protein